jgi:hypothetical protein
MGLTQTYSKVVLHQIKVRIWIQGQKSEYWKVYQTKLLYLRIMLLQVLPIPTKIKFFFLTKVRWIQGQSRVQQILLLQIKIKIKVLTVLFLVLRLL